MIKRILKKLVVNTNARHWTFWPNEFEHPETFFEIDADFHTQYEKSQINTQMSKTDNPLRRQRHYVLLQLLKSAAKLEGDIAEMGCWRGLSSHQMATHLKSKSFEGQYHIFDSFEGLSEYETVDIAQDREQDLDAIRKSFACSQETVQNNLKEFTFIHYHKGWIPERFSDVADRTFSFVHIDVDLYQPIKDSIEFFFPRMCKGAIMVFDDYGSNEFPGAKKAVDEFLNANPKIHFVSMPAGNAYLLKN